jgi:hypothetical protein
MYTRNLIVRAVVVTAVATALVVGWSRPAFASSLGTLSLLCVCFAIGVALVLFDKSDRMSAYGITLASVGFLLQHPLVRQRLAGQNAGNVSFAYWLGMLLVLAGLLFSFGTSIFPKRKGAR